VTGGADIGKELLHLLPGAGILDISLEKIVYSFFHQGK
jgi:hypothetical protein